MGFSSIQKTASTGSSATGALVGANSLQPSFPSTTPLGLGCQSPYTLLELIPLEWCILDIRTHVKVEPRWAFVWMVEMFCFGNLERGGGGPFFLFLFVGFNFVM